MKHSKLCFRSCRLLCVSLLAGCCILGGCGQAASDGSGIKSGMAECIIPENGSSYTIYIDVEVDDDGTITSVSDGGTKIPDGKDAKYIKAQEIFGELIGKTAEEVDSVDAVSGATCSCDAIKAAVKQALED